MPWVTEVPPGGKWNSKLGLSSSPSSTLSVLGFFLVTSLQKRCNRNLVTSGTVLMGLLFP